MERLVIVGAGGHGREILDLIEACNALAPTYEVVGFVADDADEALLARRGVPWLGPVTALDDTDASHALAIGMPWSRRHVASSIPTTSRPVSLLHPSATIGGDNSLAPGTIVCAGARITTNIALGRHTHLNINAVVSHDSKLGDFVTVSPGAIVNGNVTIHDDVFIGTGAVVTPGITIGRGAKVGAGAVVLDDVPDGATVVGVPARTVR